MCLKLFPSKSRPFVLILHFKMLPCQGQGWHSRLGKGEGRRERGREKPFSLISAFPCVIRALMKWVTGGRAEGLDPPPYTPHPCIPFWGASLVDRFLGCRCPHWGHTGHLCDELQPASAWVLREEHRAALWMAGGWVQVGAQGANHQHYGMSMGYSAAVPKSGAAGASSS